MNDLNAFTGLVRRCVEDYDMIAPLSLIHI